MRMLFVGIILGIYANFLLSIYIDDRVNLESPKAAALNHQIEKLQMDNAALRNEIYSESSYRVIVEKAKALGFEPNSEFYFLHTLDK